MTLSLTEVLQNAPSMIGCVDRAGRLIYANRAWGSALGLSSTDDLNLVDFLSENSVDHCKRVLDAVMSGSPISRFCAEFLRQDKTTFWAEGSLECIHEDGKPTYAVCAFSELDAKARMASLQDRFFEVSLDLLCVADFDGYFRLLNPAWERTLGYELDELIDRPFLDFVHPDDQDRTIAESQRITLGAASVSFRNRYRHKDGSYRWVRWVAASDVETRTILACAHDITEELEHQQVLREAHEAAEAASVAKSSFLANMSHELRTPLNSVIGFSELLSDEAFGPLNPKQSRYVENILTNGRHLLGLINDVLDLSKVEAGEMDFELKRIDLSVLVSHVVEQMRPLATKRGQELLLDGKCEAVVIADEDRTRQILLNLLSNAIKFTSDGGQVGVNILPGSKEHQVTVWDTGAGLSESDLPKVFERFKQLDSGLTRKESGTGLGLALCRHFVDQQKGRLWATSEGKGKGSQFHFALRAPHKIVKNEEMPMELGEEPLVLVVEDDPGSSELLTTHLASAGYRTVRAFTGRRAIKLAEDLQPGAITLDLQLPDMSGWEVLHELKASSSTRSIPVIISSIVEEKAQGLSLQASDFVPKPIDRQSLLASVGRWLPAGQSRKVLVIDDDPDTLELISHWLESQGLEVHEASSGEQGLELLKECLPDAAVVDINMPGMNGIETIDRIRELHSNRIPIVAFTSAFLTRTEQKRLNSQVDGILCKSQREDLLKVLRSVFQKESDR